MHLTLKDSMEPWQHRNLSSDFLAISFFVPTLLEKSHDISL